MIEIPPKPPESTNLTVRKYKTSMKGKPFNKELVPIMFRAAKAAKASVAPVQVLSQPSIEPPKLK